MQRLRAFFSKDNLPMLILLVAVYLVGRMEGEGRFTWSDVLGRAWNTTTTISANVFASAKDVVGM